MAVFTAIDDSGSFYNTTLYTGTGASNAITGVGFQPDFTWIKQRDASDNHILTDAARGATNYVNSDRNNAQATNAESLKSFDSDGFTLGNHAAINGNTDTFASWNWKAGTSSGLSGGTITPTAYSINTTSGFGVYAYTGSGSNATIAHGLGVAPKLVMVKRLNGTDSWRVFHTYLGGTKYLTLNSNAGPTTEATIWNSTAPDATVFSIGTDSSTNTSTDTYIAYVWAEVKGYSKISSYTGNGVADGTVVYTGFRPALFIPKILTSSTNWGLQDTARDTYNPADKTLNPDDAASVQTGSGQYIDYLSNGFKIRNSSSWYNGSGETFVYVAFASNPFVNSSGVPGNAR